MNNIKKSPKEQKIKNHHYQQNKKKSFPRISSWTSSLSSLAHQPRSQQQKQEFIITTPKNNNLTSTPLSNTHCNKHPNTTRPSSSTKNTWWSSLFRRNSVNPGEQVKNPPVKPEGQLQTQFYLKNNNTRMIDSNNHRHRDRLNKTHVISRIPLPSTTASSYQVTILALPTTVRCNNSNNNNNNPPITKNWLHHPFDWVNGTRNNQPTAITQHPQQKQQDKNHNTFISPPTIEKENDHTISSISSSSQSSFTSSSTSSINTNANNFSDSIIAASCITATTEQDTVVTTLSSLSTKTTTIKTKKFTTMRLYDSIETLQTICCIWLSVHFLLQTVICMTLVVQQQKQTSTHDVSKGSYHFHYSQHVKKGQRKENRSFDDGSTNTTTYGLFPQKTMYKKLTASASLSSILSNINHVTPTKIPECWPPLIESDIISNAVQRMGPSMKELWEQHERNMMSYKQQFPVRPTERRKWMRQRRDKMYYQNNCNSQNEEGDSSDDENSQAVMDLAKETLKYFEQWYGGHPTSNENDTNDQSSSFNDEATTTAAQLKTISWLRQAVAA